MKRKRDGEGKENKGNKKNKKNGFQFFNSVHKPSQSAGSGFNITSEQELAETDATKILSSLCNQPPAEFDIKSEAHIKDLLNYLCNECGMRETPKEVHSLNKEIENYLRRKRMYRNLKNIYIKNYLKDENYLIVIGESYHSRYILSDAALKLIQPSAKEQQPQRTGNNELGNFTSDVQTTVAMLQPSQPSEQRLFAIETINYNIMEPLRDIQDLLSYLRQQINTGNSQNLKTGIQTFFEDKKGKKLEDDRIDGICYFLISQNYIVEESRDGDSCSYSLTGKSESLIESARPDKLWDEYFSI